MAPCFPGEALSGRNPCKFCFAKLRRLCPVCAGVVGALYARVPCMNAGCHFLWQVQCLVAVAILVPRSVLGAGVLYFVPDTVLGGMAESLCLQGAVGCWNVILAWKELMSVLLSCDVHCVAWRGLFAVGVAFAGRGINYLC